MDTLRKRTSETRMRQHAVTQSDRTDFAPVKAPPIQFLKDRYLPSPVCAGQDCPAGSLLQQLQTHQLELELQNDSLRRTQAELDLERIRFSDLYDNAPVGYCNVTAQGRIVKANHFMATLLGANRLELFKQQITPYIFGEDQDIYARMGQRLTKLNEPQSCDLRMVKSDGTLFWAHLTANVQNGNGVHEFGIVISDTTESRQQERQRLLNETAHRASLVREVHHRIKNSLQGVTGILRNYANHHPEMSDPMNHAIGQIQAISMVHGLQGRDPTGSVLIMDLIKSIAREIKELWHTSVELEAPSKLPQWSLAESESVPIALVINELMVNAVKHGSQLQRSVLVSLQDGPCADAVQIRITNVGKLSPDRRIKGPRRGGLQLVSALLPSAGAHFSLQQLGHEVVTLLELESPVVRQVAQDPQPHSA
jgi:PAS domain S-box-containing protein